MSARYRNNLAVSSFRSVANLAGVLPAYSAKRDPDAQFIENLCRTTRDLPSMRAAMQQTPELLDIGVYPSSFKDKSLGRYYRTGIEISMDFRMGEMPEDRFNIQLATLPHELRHGYQSVMHCSVCFCDTRILGDLESLILIDRHLEADATVFSIAAMYELYLQGDTAPWDWAGKVHPPSVDAYEQETKRDLKAHWDGNAAHAAFGAYFSDNNKKYLKEYDLRICQNFTCNAKRQQKYEPVSPEARQYIVYDSLRPICRMPYEDEAGLLVPRPNYMPLLCENVMNALSHEVREHLDRARKAALTHPSCP